MKSGKKGNNLGRPVLENENLDTLMILVKMIKFTHAKSSNKSIRRLLIAIFLILELLKDFCIIFIIPLEMKLLDVTTILSKKIKATSEEHFS